MQSWDDTFESRSELADVERAPKPWPPTTVHAGEDDDGQDHPADDDPELPPP